MPPGRGSAPEKPSQSEVQLQVRGFYHDKFTPQPASFPGEGAFSTAMQPMLQTNEIDLEGLKRANRERSLEVRRTLL